MEKIISLDSSKAEQFLEGNAFLNIQKEAKKAYQTLHDKNGLGKEFLGWLELPLHYDKEEFKRILAASKKIKSESKVLLVIGIGGSYLGAKAAIEALNPYFKKRKGLEVIFVGHHISGAYVSDLIKYLEGKDFSINVISKSGTTTEPAIAFRIFKDLLENKYGREEAKKRIYATTDKARGALKELATHIGYETFIVPDDIGGRFSVLTAVGLLPIACSGIDIKKMMDGAKKAYKDYLKFDIEDNDCLRYAIIRNLLYRNGKSIEMLVNYEPKLQYFSEWWKQLFGESEGKENKGLFVASAAFSTDLHSLGQYIQDGQRIMFESIINIVNNPDDVSLPLAETDLDGLNYLAGKSMDFVNKKAMLGTMLAHVEGKVPNIIVNLNEMNSYNFGYLIYFFEKACGISGYLLGVNPFDQPGVESYKKNMFALLGKKGFEDLKKSLEEKL